jgi:hypothetical protein
MNRTLWLIVILVVAIGAFFYFDKKSLNAPENGTDQEELGDPVETENIKVSSPLPGQVISSPLTVSGEARGMWYFEATFPVSLVDEDGEVIFESFIEADGEWMTENFVPFEKEFTFSAPVGTKATLVLMRSNASGLPEHDASVSVPVVIGSTAVSEETSFSVFFSSESFGAGSVECDEVSAVEREVSKTQAVARAALNALLAGPTQAETNQGLTTNIPNGVELNDIRIENGTAYVDFSEELNQVGGSCSVTAIRAQIEETLLQFPTVDDVVISVSGGNPDEALQP